MVELRGQLRWIDLAGGCWSLEVDPTSNDQHGTIVLDGYQPTGELTDGMLVAARGELETGGGDIMMAGPRMRVTSVVRA